MSLGGRRFSEVNAFLRSIWLDEHSSCLPLIEQAYLDEKLTELGGDVQGLFSELVKRLDENPRKVLMLITTRAMSNQELAEALDCAPSSIERYRQAIRRKLEEIVTGQGRGVAAQLGYRILFATSHVVGRKGVATRRCRLFFATTIAIQINAF